jgi:hypothetical protein
VCSVLKLRGTEDAESLVLVVFLRSAGFQPAQSAARDGRAPRGMRLKLRHYYMTLASSVQPRSSPKFGNVYTSSGFRAILNP